MTKTTPVAETNGVNEKSEVGTVHWESLNDTKDDQIEEDQVPRPKAPLRNLSMGDNNSIDEDAYDASQDFRRSFSRQSSLEVADRPHIIIETPWTNNTSHSSSKPPKSSSSHKKSKDAPPIPAAADGGTSDRIRLGICAMDKKARSKPMAEILSRLDETDFQVVFFGDDVILHQPVEEWPICDVVVAFFSKGYPLPKAKEYVALRKPFILNDLEMQEVRLKNTARVCVGATSGMVPTTTQGWLVLTHNLLLLFIYSYSKTDAKYTISWKPRVLTFPGTCTCRAMATKAPVRATATATGRRKCKSLTITLKSTESPFTNPLWKNQWMRRITTLPFITQRRPAGAAKSSFGRLATGPVIFTPKSMRYVHTHLM